MAIFATSELYNKFCELIPKSQNVRIAVAGLGAVAFYLLARKVFWPTRLIPAKGKAVIVTGCDSATGFGYATARRLHQLGYVIFAGCRDVKKAEEETYADLVQKNSARFHIIQLDVTNKEQIKKAVEQVDNWLKANPDFHLYGLVNNAGIGGVFSPLEWVGMATFINVFDVNCFGTVRVTKAFLPLIRRARDGGRVVVMSSIAAELPNPFSTSYCASKAAVNAVVECLGIEISQFGIKVSSICPDFYQTNMITNSERNIAALEREVSALNPATFEAYGGQGRVDRMKTALGGLTNIAKADLSPVVDCVVDALASPSPKRRYHPINFFNRFAKVLYYTAPSLLNAMMGRLIDA